MRRSSTTGRHHGGRASRLHRVVEAEPSCSRKVAEEDDDPGTTEWPAVVLLCALTSRFDIAPSRFVCSLPPHDGSSTVGQRPLVRSVTYSCERWRRRRPGRASLTSRDGPGTLMKLPWIGSKAVRDGVCSFFENSTVCRMSVPCCLTLWPGWIVVVWLGWGFFECC